MERLQVAFATDDGINFMDRHFGDAKFYQIYAISEKNAEFIKEITVDTKEDVDVKGGDPSKVAGMVSILKLVGVDVVVSKVFGPNIKRLKKKFVCIVTDGSIKDGIKRVQENYLRIENEVRKGEGRNHLILRS